MPATGQLASALAPSPVAVRLDVRIALLGARARHAVGPVIERHLDHLGGVERAAVGELLDLGLAGEAVGDQQRVGGRLADDRQEAGLARSYGEVAVGLPPAQQ